MVADAWQLVLVDALFLCIAGGIGFWLYVLLRAQRRELDARLERLEEQTQGLGRVQATLERVCARLEGLATAVEQADTMRSPAVPSGAGDTPTKEAAAVPAAPGDRYEQAWSLLQQGLSSNDVARRLGLGLAETELMSRIQRHRQRS